ncbi:ovalbumin-related protein X-like [Argonauta hians]
MYKFNIFLVSIYFTSFLDKTSDSTADTSFVDYDKMQRYKHHLSVPINDFTLNIFKNFDSKIGNTLWSPFLLSMALSFLQMTGESNSAEKIQNLIYPSVSWELFHKSFSEYLQTLQDISHIQLSNKLYIDSASLTQIRTETNKYYFLELEEINPKTIEKLSDKFHKNRISNFMSFGNSIAGKLMILVNSLHFQGLWKYQFNRKFTMSEHFYISENHTEVIEMMYTEDFFVVKSDEQHSFRSLEIPFLDVRFSLYIILPDDIEGIETIEKQLTSRLLWQIIANKGSPRNIALILPKFQIKSNFTFQDVLFKEKIGHLFNVDSSNLTNMHAHLVDTLHQGFMNFNELGTISSPASSRKSSHILEKKAKFDMSFTVNHPFLFFIVDKTSFMILHIGKFMQPSSSTNVVHHTQQNHDEL